MQIIRALMKARAGSLLMAYGAAVAFVRLGVFHAGTAKAGHTLGYKDSYHPGGTCGNQYNKTCRTNWQGPATLMKIPLIDQFSAEQPYWENNAEDARYNWSVAPGPQWLQWYAQSNDSYVFLKVDHQGYTDDYGYQTAITRNCDRDNNCYFVNTPLNIHWSGIYFHPDRTNELDEVGKTALFAHEYGHALGPWHHDSEGHVMARNNQSIQGRQSGHIGAYPCPSAPEDWGVKCIYEYS